MTDIIEAAIPAGVSDIAAILAATEVAAPQPARGRPSGGRSRGG